MTRIRSAIAAALLVFSTASIVAAQQPARQPARQALRQARVQQLRRNVAKRLFKGVQPSETERANLKAVRQKYAAQRQALRASNTVDRAQVVALRQAERNDLRGALSAANQVKFDANLAAIKRRAAKRGRPIKP